MNEIEKESNFSLYALALICFVLGVIAIRDSYVFFTSFWLSTLEWKLPYLKDLFNKQIFYFFHVPLVLTTLFGPFLLIGGLGVLFKKTWARLLVVMAFTIRILMIQFSIFMKNMHFEIESVYTFRDKFEIVSLLLLIYVLSLSSYRKRFS